MPSYWRSISHAKAINEKKCKEKNRKKNVSATGEKDDSQEQPF
jgi:hypothetical protein